MSFKIADIDFIFLSFDEPNGEKNFANLKKKVPWAKRVHGVYGFDAAHKACAEASDTERFITVDGDTVIEEDFTKVMVDFPSLGVDNTYQFSWCGRIDLNGLQYGNGSLKCWTKDFVMNMKTHENHDGKDKNVIEFCHFDNYYQFNENFSTSYINASPFQAWRAGFREGVKMSLDRNARVSDLKDLWWQNYQRLLVWLNVGADVENGYYAIHGARLGCYLVNCTDWDIVKTREFDFYDKYWRNELNLKGQNDPFNIDRCKKEIVELGQKIIDKTGIELSVNPLSPEQSRFFKEVYLNTPRIWKRRRNV
jgi:hypothetical protein